MRITVIFITLQWKMGLIYADQIIFHPKKGSGADARVGLLEWPLWYLMDECVKNYSAQKITSSLHFKHVTFENPTIFVFYYKYTCRN